MQERHSTVVAEQAEADSPLVSPISGVIRKNSWIRGRAPYVQVLLEDCLSSVRTMDHLRTFVKVAFPEESLRNGVGRQIFNAFRQHDDAQPIANLSGEERERFQSWMVASFGEDRVQRWSREKPRKY